MILNPQIAVRYRRCNSIRELHLSCTYFPNLLYKSFTYRKLKGETLINIEISFIQYFYLRMQAMLFNQAQELSCVHKPEVK